MDNSTDQIEAVKSLLLKRIDTIENKSDILKAVELKALFDQIKTMPQEQRSAFGKAVNDLRLELINKVNESKDQAEEIVELDITAPYEANIANTYRPTFFASKNGSIHPLNKELDYILDIFYRMGFTSYQSREIDDDFHMFSSLNFPVNHPARDDYDTFITKQQASDGSPLIAPAHTSTMQNRVLTELKPNLENQLPIAAVIPGRVFRNEDLDARHEHTFYQVEGVYVGENVHAGMLIATLKTFLQAYFQKPLEVKTQPFYFPFTEPSFEFALSCPFCDKKGCHVCSQTGWIELLGCGMIHPNVLKQAAIDPETYTGFAWGFGIERLVMMKYNIEDIRYFESGRLDFLRQFV